MLYHSFHVYVKETPVSFGVLFLLERETVVQRTTATVGSCAMTETWRPILQQLITELERQSVRMRELEAQRLVDLSVSWRFFMGCHFFLELEKYEICNAYIYIRYTNEYIYIFYTPIRNILYTYEFYVNMHHIDKKRWCVRHLSTKIQNFNGELWCLERRRKFKAQEGRRFPDFHLPVWIESLGRIGCATDFHQTWVPGGSQDLRCK